MNKTSEFIVQSTHQLKDGTFLVGGFVRSGKIKNTDTVTVYRNYKPFSTYCIKDLRRFKEKVEEVTSGFECGMLIDSFEPKVDDIFTVE